jgi:biopolymer transport protein ExbB
MRTIQAIALIFMVSLLLLPARAEAWWNEDWAYRMRIVVGAEPAGGGAPRDAGRATVLVRLHQGVFNFNNAKEDGTDLRFVAGDGRTPLRFYVERYDSLSDQVGLFWVTIPDLKLGGEGTPIYAYWGNRNAPPAGSARDSFGPETVLALNFGEDGGQLRDATGYGNNPGPGAGGRREDGLVAAGHSLSGRDIIALVDGPTLGWRAGETMTWSLWVRPDRAASTGVLYQARLAEGGLLTLGLADGAPYAELTSASAAPVRLAGATRIDAETWRHVALVAAGGQLNLFLDARSQAAAPAALPAGGGAATLGGPLPVLAGGAEPLPGFAGRIDVVRIAKADRSGAALEVAVRAEGARGDLLRFDVAEEGSIFGTGHFGIIAKNLTLDAWIVIGICAVMAPFTWWIFGRKALYIAASAKANAAFRRAFRSALAEAGAEGIAGVRGLSDVTSHKKFRASPLYRMWRTSLEELETRGGITRAGNLSEPSLAAIHAAVDREITLEGQKLSSGIVVLTIAIAGGPFIGLLGTVIGVMVTFAAVAAAGDVNVNAIAPGIAAALAATVAGLAVAIPALFAYNYLLTRIRDLNADMRIFSEELVTRIGEGGIAQAEPLPRAAE